jgi:OFA family oxalate/formate antiporter-like MFS transporter
MAGPTQSARQGAVGNRWLIAAAGVVMQIALGAVYAWSVFRIPLTKEFGWSISQVTVTFTPSIFFLGLAAVFGGLWMARVGPRTVGLTAAGLYGAGVFLASLSADKLWVLYLTYGVLAGIGLGFGYIVPVATLVKWFPDKRGMITGIAVAGFGAGALVTAPIATRLIESRGVLPTFAILGVIYLVMVAGAALLMRNPPEGYQPAGWEPSEAQKAQRSARDYTVKEAVRTWQWYALWGVAVPQRDRRHRHHLPGRPHGRGDHQGERHRRRRAGRHHLHRQRGRTVPVGLAVRLHRPKMGLPGHVPDPGRGLLPPATGHQLRAVRHPGLHHPALLWGRLRDHASLRGRLLRPKNVGSVYGLMLTAWGVAGIVGPTLITRIRESSGAYSNALYVISGIMLVSAVIPFIVRPPLSQQAAAAEETAPASSPAPPRHRTT